MSKRIFIASEIEESMNNPNVLTCSPKSITFHSDFKKKAIKKYYDDGFSPPMIFREAGFNKQLVSNKKACTCLNRWRRIYNLKGNNQLSTENRGKSTLRKGRPSKNSLTVVEKLEKMEAEIAYLKAENAFLAKLRGLKRK